MGMGEAGCQSAHTDLDYPSRTNQRPAPSTYTLHATTSHPPHYLRTEDRHLVPRSFLLSYSSRPLQFLSKSQFPCPADVTQATAFQCRVSSDAYITAYNGGIYCPKTAHSLDLVRVLWPLLFHFLNALCRAGLA
ncbi:hypothetical protein F5Y03DRAFT_283826 [Xylaria venustula]|nr:hypothetical protein F5Y03DRAFT_283826 [Xylaria venustula]